MSVVEKLRCFEIEEYLRNEQRGEVRHELVRGVVYTMVGSSSCSHGDMLQFQSMNFTCPVEAIYEDVLRGS